MSDSRSERRRLRRATDSRRRELSSTTRSGVQATVCVVESNRTPRKVMRCEGPSVFSGLTTRPKSSNTRIAVARVVWPTASEPSTKRKSSR